MVTHAITHTNPEKFTQQFGKTLLISTSLLFNNSVHDV